MNGRRILCAAMMALAVIAAMPGGAGAQSLKTYQAAQASRECLTPDTRALLEAAEAHFGVRFKLVSTCRPGAVIAGSGKPSLHRHGRAVDFKPPAGVAKRAVVAWLFGRTRGVVMTYRRMAHIHFDTGPFHKLALAR